MSCTEPTRETIIALQLYAEENVAIPPIPFGKKTSYATSEEHKFKHLKLPQQSYNCKESLPEGL